MKKIITILGILLGLAVVFCAGMTFKQTIQEDWCLDNGGTVKQAVHDYCVFDKKEELVNSNKQIQILKDIAKNGTFTVDEKEINLVNGVSLDSKIRYEGTSRIIDTNGDGTDDILYVVIENSNGSGTFYYLAGQISSLENYNGTYSLFLGDRIEPLEIYINKKNNFVIKYLDRALGEPMSAKPSIEIEKEFGIYENEIYVIESIDSSLGDSIPVPTLHETWDVNNDGANDCEDDGICDDSVDYSQSRVK